MEWISVKDKLPPDEAKNYIVIYDRWGKFEGKRDQVDVCMWVQKYKKNKGLYWSWVSKPGFPAWDVIYWTDLPIKPKEFLSE